MPTLFMLILLLCVSLAIIHLTAKVVITIVYQKAIIHINTFRAEAIQLAISCGVVYGDI